jgi:hypothetical protein
VITMSIQWDFWEHHSVSVHQIPKKKQNFQVLWMGRRYWLIFWGFMDGTYL